MIVYKVVEKKTRYGSNMIIFKKYCQSGLDSSDYIRRRIIRAKRFIKENPEYFPRYFRNTVVESVKESLGILTFENEEAANEFQRINSITGRSKVVTVRGIGTPREVTYLYGGCGADPSNLKGSISSTRAPFGTVAFESVKVLD